MATSRTDKEIAQIRERLEKLSRDDDDKLSSAVTAYENALQKGEESLAELAALHPKPLLSAGWKALAAIAIPFALVLVVRTFALADERMRVDGWLYVGGMYAALAIVVSALFFTRPPLVTGPTLPVYSLLVVLGAASALTDMAVNKLFFASQ